MKNLGKTPPEHECDGECEEDEYYGCVRRMELGDDQAKFFKECMLEAAEELQKIASISDTRGIKLAKIDGITSVAKQLRKSAGVNPEV